MTALLKKKIPIYSKQTCLPQCSFQKLLSYAFEIAVKETEMKTRIFYMDKAWQTLQLCIT